MILVLNAGSSTFKYGLFDAQTLESRTSGTLDQLPVEALLEHLLQARLIRSRADIRAVGHRVVHGGEHFSAPVRIDQAVIADIEALVPLSPLHNPPALRMIEAAQRALPNVPHVAVFDTAFFAALPTQRMVYPLPYEWYSEWGIRRFGFHGISHAYCSERAAKLLGHHPGGCGVIVCHLGSGCSATAVLNGKPLATTMGFTPLEGLMMATRSGSIDPAILFYLMKEKGLTADALEQTLYQGSGLQGVSGVSADMREVEKAAQEGNARAQLALELYADRVRSTVGSLAVLMDRLDAIVFTAGVGEHSAMMRRMIGGGLRSLGIILDSAKNATAQADADIAALNSKVRVLVLHTREEERIARDVQKELHL